MLYKLSSQFCLVAMLLLALISIAFSDPKYSIFIKSDKSTKDFENRLLDNLEDLHELYRFLYQKSNKTHEQYCEGKSFTDCSQSLPYRSAAYVISHTIQVSSFDRYDLGEFLLISPQATHLIILLPKESYMGDQLNFKYLSHLMNVSFVYLGETGHHRLDLIGGDKTEFVDRMYLESVDADIYTNDKLKVGSVVLYDSSYSPMSNTYTIDETVPLFIHGNSYTHLRSTQVNDVEVFADLDKPVDKIGSASVHFGDEQYDSTKSPFKDNLIVITNSENMEVLDDIDLTIKYQKPLFLKMRDIFKCILEYNSDQDYSSKILGTINKKEEANEDDTFTLKFMINSSSITEIQLPPEKKLKVLDNNGNEIDISTIDCIIRANLIGSSLNVDDLDFKNLPTSISTPTPTPMPTPIEEEKTADEKFAIFIKSNKVTQEFETRLFDRLSDLGKLYKFLLQKSIEKHEQYCNGKSMVDCPQAFPYRSAAYVISRTIQVSDFGRYDTGKIKQISKEATHLIMILPGLYYNGDQLNLRYLPKRMNVSIVYLDETRRHSLDMIGGDNSNYVDRLYLESIHAKIYTTGNLDVGSLILFNSSYSSLYNTYTVDEIVPLYIHTSSYPQLHSTQVNNVYVFGDYDKPIEKIGYYSVYSGNEEFKCEKTPFKKKLTVITNSNNFEVTDSVSSTIKYQMPIYLKMRDIFKCILEYDFNEDYSSKVLDTISYKKERIKDDTFTLKFVSSYYTKTEIQLPPEKKLKVFDSDDNEIDISNNDKVNRTDIVKSQLNVDDIDFKNMPTSISTPTPSPLPQVDGEEEEEEEDSGAPRYAIFIKKYYSTVDEENRLMARLNRTDLLYDFLLGKSEELYELNCNGKDHKECKESFSYRSAAYVLSHTIQVSLFTRYDLGNFLRIDKKATHLIIVLHARSYSADQISFSVLPRKMNVTIVGIEYSRHNLDMIGGDRREKVDQLFLESVHADIYTAGKLQVGSVIMDTSSYSPLYNTYTIKEDVPLYMNANSLPNLESTESDEVSIFTTTNKLKKISFDPDLSIYSGNSQYAAKSLPTKKVLTVYTTSDSLELNFDELPSNFLKKIIISYQKPQYIKMRDVISRFLEFSLPNDESLSSSKMIDHEKKMKRKKIKENAFYLQLNGNDLDNLPSTFSIEIQLPPKKILKIVDKDGFPISMAKYKIIQTDVVKTPVNIDYLDFDNLVPNITISKPTPKYTLQPTNNPDNFLKGVPKDFYNIVLYGSIIVLLGSGVIVIICIVVRSDE